MGTLTLTGFAAYLLLWGAVLSGIAVAVPRWGGTGFFRLGARWHEGLSLAALALGVVHGVEAVSERFGGAWWLVVVRSGAAIQVGVAALFLLAAVVIAFYLRRRLRRLWRAIHLLVYPAFVLVLWHGLVAGANAWLPAVRLLYAVTALSAAAAAAARIAAVRRGRGEPSPRRV